MVRPETVAPGVDAPRDDWNDPGAPLNVGILTKALEGLKLDLYEKLDLKMDSFSKVLHSEMTLIKDELKSSVATLQATVTSHSSIIKDLELSATTCSDNLSSLSNTVDTLKTEIKVLQAKCEDLEGRSRRNNIRLVGVPEGLEGPRPREYISKCLQDMLNLDEPPLLDCAHRSLREKPREGGPPRPFIISVHYFHVKKKDVVPGGGSCSSPESWQ